MKFFIETKRGYVLNVPKAEALLRKVDSKVLSIIIEEGPLTTVKHGSHNIFFTPDATPMKKEHAEKVEADLVRLAKTARFKGIKAFLAKVQLTLKFLVS